MDINHSPRHTYRFLARLKTNGRSSDQKILEAHRTKQVANQALLTRLADVIEKEAASVSFSSGAVKQTVDDLLKTLPAIEPCPAKFRLPVKRREFSTKKADLPILTICPDGLRIETYAHGAEITKDSFGRVLEVRAASGEMISFHFDGDGNLESFSRTKCCGQLHSFARSDSGGVVVRDSEGRVRAQGESMSVDPHGCLFIHQGYDQTVCLDFVRGLHIERRRLACDEHSQTTVTAVFAHDGFRMGTYFHVLPLTRQGGPVAFGSHRRSCVRLYGRDGSLVEFASEDDIQSLTPQKVLPPGSIFVEPSWRNKRQAGTAWETAEEYLQLLC